MRRLLPALLLVSTTPGCVEPLSDDTVPPRDIYEPDDEAADRPWITGDGSVTIRRLDGIDDENPIAHRLSGFVGGRRVWFWDFGPTADFVAPLWELVRRNDAGEIEVIESQPPIWDVIPGDRGYSPFWEVYFAEVTHLYHGQILTSRQAIDDAVRTGLILQPLPAGLYANCPVVDRHAFLEVAGHPEGTAPCKDDETKACKPASAAYYRGVKVGFFDTNGPLPFDHDGGLPDNGTVYRLQREDEALPISEPDRQVDLTGDGDIVDTNDVFDSALEDEEYTPVRQLVDVFVATDYSSIDTVGRDRAADVRAADELEGEQIRGRRETGQLVNWPLEANDCSGVTGDDCATCERTQCCFEFFACQNDDACFRAAQTLATCLAAPDADPAPCLEAFTTAGGPPATTRLTCRTASCAASCG